MAFMAMPELSDHPSYRDGNKGSIRIDKGIPQSLLGFNNGQPGLIKLPSWLSQSTVPSSATAAVIGYSSATSAVVEVENSMNGE